TTLVHEKGAAETVAMIADARQSATISFDPNCRPNLVRDRETYRARMSAFAKSADIIRMSDVDFNYLYVNEKYAAKAESLLAGGCGLFVITRGINGVLACHQATGAIECEALSVWVVLMIGAVYSLQVACLICLY